MITLFENPSVKRRTYTQAPDDTGACSEAELADMLGISRQTLRNRRVGCTTPSGKHPPTLVENVHWFKVRKNKRGKVYYYSAWVQQVLEAKRTLKTLGL